MGLPPWEISDSQLFTLITGANSGLGFAIASRMIDEFMTSPSTPSNKHLVLILCTREPLKTKFTIFRLRAHLRKLVETSPFAAQQREKATAEGKKYRWDALVHKVHLLGVEADLCDLRSVYALADKLVNGTVGSPEDTTIEGRRLPHESPETHNFSDKMDQDHWSPSQEPGSTGAQRSWGWGLSGIKVPRLDVLILNAGMGGWIGLDWLGAVRDILLDPIDAVTWPKYKLPNVGAAARSQLRRKIGREEEKQPILPHQEKAVEPPLGEVFCSNVFGHYILSHELMPLLSRPADANSQAGGKIILISSIEAISENFSIDDIQGLRSQTPYEGTKRLSDLLTLTANLPAIQRISSPFFNPTNTIAASKPSFNPVAGEETVRPTMYVIQPGIFASEIMPLNWFLVLCYKAVFFFVRWMGSPWHPIAPYKAAVAPVWIALTDSDTLEGMGGSNIKWGSSTDKCGNERVKKTEVDGWGWDGEVGSTTGGEGEMRKGRRKNAVDLTREAREDFEILGAKCWSEMEGLRKEWEEILGVKNGK